MKNGDFWANLPAIIAAIFAGVMSLLTWWRAGRTNKVVNNIQETQVKTKDDISVIKEKVINGH